MVIFRGQGGSTRLFSEFAQLVPELAARPRDPETETLSLLRPMAKPRMYHAAALLLLDGRVLPASGGACGNECIANQFDYEILTSLYLLDAAGGTPAARPVITSAPATAAAGSSVSVAADSAASFALVRMSSVMHSTNNDQRRIPLAWTRILVRGAYVLPLPRLESLDATLPGNCMLFRVALSASGTPSVARVIRLG